MIEFHELLRRTLAGDHGQHHPGADKKPAKQTSARSKPAPAKKAAAKPPEAPAADADA